MVSFAQLFNVSMRILFLFPLLSMVSPVSAAALQSGNQSWAWDRYIQVRKEYKPTDYYIGYKREGGKAMSLSKDLRRAILKSLILRKVPEIYENAYRYKNRKYKAFKQAMEAFRNNPSLYALDCNQARQDWCEAIKYWDGLNERLCTIEYESDMLLALFLEINKFVSKGVRNDGSNRSVKLNKDVAGHIKSFLFV